MKAMVQQFEKERRELLEACRDAEEARYRAEETVNSEKAEYEQRVCIDRTASC
jgi:hypothetical protein